MRNAWSVWRREKVIEAIIYGISWAGIVMLYEFSMREGNILGWWWEWMDSRKKSIYKALGLCPTCFAFWFGLRYLIIDYKHYFIFLGVSQIILLFYLAIILLIRK